MNEAVRAENKKEDKKFMGRFLLILVAAFLVGIAAGTGIAFLEEATELTAQIASTAMNVLVTIAPYVSVVFVIVMGSVILLTRRKVSAMAEAWDGENEAEYDKMDSILGNVMSVLSVCMVIVYFFFAIGFEEIVERSAFADCCYFFGFIAALAVIMGGQSSLIKLTKELNPEKKGSVYDMNFIDKWEDSCDEAEKILIYKSAFSTYTKMSNLYVTIWIFCVFGNAIFHFGFMPVTMVSVLWICQVCMYTHYSKYYSKHPEKIGVFK